MIKNIQSRKSAIIRISLSALLLIVFFNFFAIVLYKNPQSAAGVTRSHKRTSFSICPKSNFNSTRTCLGTCFVVKGLLSTRRRKEVMQCLRKLHFHLHSDYRAYLCARPGPQHQLAFTLRSKQRNFSSSHVDFETQSTKYDDTFTENDIEIINRHAVACKQRKSTYIDPQTGYSVFTEYYHKERGYCCGHQCRHCPFGHENVPKNKKT